MNMNLKVRSEQKRQELQNREKPSPTARHQFCIKHRVYPSELLFLRC